MNWPSLRRMNRPVSPSLSASSRSWCMLSTRSSSTFRSPLARNHPFSFLSAMRSCLVLSSAFSLKVSPFGQWTVRALLSRWWSSVSSSRQSIGLGKVRAVGCIAGAAKARAGVDGVAGRGDLLLEVTSGLVRPHHSRSWRTPSRPHGLGGSGGQTQVSAGRGVRHSSLRHGG